MDSNIKKIVTVVGARPQFIKAAAVSNALKEYDEIEEVVIHTGQHYDHEMSDIFFTQLGIAEPDLNLGIPGGSHGAATGKMLELLEEQLITIKPDALLVYGDTNSSLAAALAAVKLHIPIIHVEAGPRVFDLANPEDVNRRIIDHISSLLFAPSQLSVDYLNAEGINNNVYFSGDVMYDTMQRFKSEFFGQDSIYFNHDEFLVMTVHRQENTTDPKNMKDIFSAVGKFSHDVLFPMHPRTKGFVSANSIEIPSNVKVVGPLGYIDLMREISNSMMVLTDSGGVQKESYFLGKNAIVLQDVSGWPELEESGVNKVVGSSEEKILEAYKLFASSKSTFKTGIYGEGNSSLIIADKILSYLNSRA